MFGTIAALLLVLAHVSAQTNSSCVQVVEGAAAGLSPYPDDEPSLTFTMEGATNLKTNNVNVVLVVDGSPSVEPEEFVLAQEFAKDTVEAFGRRNIFENGGTASYVQFSGSTSYEGTFDSPESFNAHVDTVIQTGSGTDIAEGLLVGVELLKANASSFGFVVLVTDGEANSGGDPVETAELIRADNTTTIFAVGVGADISNGTLLGIAGEEVNVFSVTDFDSLEAAVADIEVIADETVLSCPATGVTITVEFDVAVSSVDSSSTTITGSTISGDNRVTFTADDLEDNPTQFAVALQRCGNVTLAEYEDEQGNSPDMSRLPDPTCNEPSRTGRGAAILVSAVVVGTAVLTALANAIDRNALLSSGVQSAIEEEARKQEAATNVQGNPADHAPAPDNMAEDSSRIADEGSKSRGEQGATDTVQGNPAYHASAPDTIAEDSSRIADEGSKSRGEQGATDTIGGNPAYHSSAPDTIAEDSSRIADEGSKSRGEQGATHTIGDNPSSQAPNEIHVEVGNDASGDDPSGQVALIFAAGSLPSTRSSSSTLVWLMVVQVQFLAVLSLVDSVGSESSWLSNFLENLRWCNFWVPIGQDSEDNTSISEKDNDIDEEDFVGNIVMFWCIGLLILVLHVLLVSAVEAYWLQATQQRERLEEARTGFGEDRPPPGYGEVAGPPPSYEEVIDAAPTHGEVAESVMDPVAAGGATTGKSDLEPVAKCRERSKSVWIHFPHVELVFLLYAVQGSLAAQLEVLRHGDGVVFYVAAIALVAYPVFMVGMVCRVVISRVRPAGGGMTFAATKEDDYYATRGRRCRRFFSRVLKGLKEEQSMFAWANKGEWRTAPTDDMAELRLGDWFRIGFEPLFADFTQSGSWFAVYALLESCVIACVGVLLDHSSQLQLLIFMGLNSAGFVVVACLKPFANRVVDIIAACRLGFNAICMALLVVAEAQDVTAHAERLETTVGVLELLFLLLSLALPVVVDTVTVLAAAARRRAKRSAACCGAWSNQTEGAGTAENNEAARRCVPQGWRATWLNMIRRNSGAYVKDVANGLRGKPHSA
eukprot:g5789.t1